jgi:hypothetical protein
MMAQQTDLAVRIATIFDAAGLNKADKAVNKLQKSTSKLGRALGISLSTVAVAAFGRTAVRAFNEDAKAAARLTNVVRNLGLSFEQTNINNFIAGLEKSASIADDVLRPAFQSLLTTTGSVTKAQELLTTAVEASRGTGYDLTTVANDLSRAYAGNTRGLQKYYLGLTKAQLASMSFEEIQAKINKTFEGANAAYLNTAAGKMEAISIATGNFAETVGGGLVDALITASGSNGVEGLVAKIDKLAQSTVNAIDEFEKFAFITAYAFNPKNIFKGGDEFTKALNAFTSAQQLAGLSPFNPMNNAVTGYKLDEKAAKLAKKQADMQAKLLKLSIDNQKKNTAELKKQAELKKAGTIFDLEQIQIVAALKGKLSDEDRKRVELQFALLTGNTKQVQTLTYEIAKAQGLSEDLAKYLASLPDAKNPFAAWDAYLDKILEKAQKAANTTSTTNTAVAVSTILNKSNVSDPSLADYGQSLVKNNVFDRAPTVPSMPATNVTKLPTTGNLSQFGAGPYLFPSSSQSNIVVQIDGKAVASALQDSSLSGIGSSVNRTGR